MMTAARLVLQRHFREYCHLGPCQCLGFRELRAALEKLLDEKLLEKKQAEIDRILRKRAEE